MSVVELYHQTLVMLVNIFTSDATILLEHITQVDCRKLKRTTDMSDFSIICEFNKHQELLNESNDVNFRKVEISL